MEKINLVHLQLVQVCKCNGQANVSETFLWKYSFNWEWVVNIILGAPDSYLVGGWVGLSTSCTW